MIYVPGVHKTCWCPFYHFASFSCHRCWKKYVLLQTYTTKVLIPSLFLLAKIWFWQVCSLVMFVTCQNLILASMLVGHVCYLPKFDFGKYVRWSCLSVCYLPKLPFWQVCWLVMFVCLLVCLFVRKFHKISRTTQLIIIKLGHRKALVHDSCKFVGQECRSNN